MTEEQIYYLDLYNKEANKAYELMHDYRFDYDTFKPIADASSKVTEQAKKVLQNLYPTYINYPIFVNGLKNIYDNSKKESDKNQEILQIKLNALNIYKEKYENLINKINSLEVEINKDELSQKINEIASLEENLIVSDELILIQKEIELEAQKLAKEKAESYANEIANKNNVENVINNNIINETNIIKDEITGIEVCLDNFGIEIDMNICRPTSGGGGGVGGGQSIKTASEIVSENIENWLKGIDTAFENQNKAKNAIKENTTSTYYNTPIEDSTQTKDNTQIDAETTNEVVEINDEKILDNEIKKDISPEDYINSFVFNVDLSNLELYKSNENNIIENIVTPDSVSTNTIQTDKTTPINQFINGKYEDNIITNDVSLKEQSIEKDSINNSMLIFITSALSIILAYNLIKNKE